MPILDVKSMDHDQWINTWHLVYGICKDILIFLDDIDDLSPDIIEDLLFDFYHPSFLFVNTYLFVSIHRSKPLVPFCAFDNVEPRDRERFSGLRLLSLSRFLLIIIQSRFLVPLSSRDVTRDFRPSTMVDLSLVRDGSSWFLQMSEAFMNFCAKFISS